MSAWYSNYSQWLFIFRYHMATCAANQSSFNETKIKQGSILAWTYHSMCFIGEVFFFSIKVMNLIDYYDVMNNVF